MKLNYHNLFLVNLKQRKYTACTRNYLISLQESHQEAVNQEAAESSQAAEQRHKDQMRQQALWQREEIRKQASVFI